MAKALLRLQHGLRPGLTADNQRSRSVSDACRVVARNSLVALPEVNRSRVACLFVDYVWLRCRRRAAKHVFTLTTDELRKRCTKLLRRHECASHMITQVGEENGLNGSARPHEMVAV